MKILVMPGSLRTGSLNARLASAAVEELMRHDADVTRVSLGDFLLPMYDGDLEYRSGVPKNANKGGKPSSRAGEVALAIVLLGGAGVGASFALLRLRGAAAP